MQQKNTDLTEKTSFESEKLPELSADLLQFLSNPKGFLRAIFNDLVHEVATNLPHNAPPPPNQEPQYIGLESAYDQYLKQFYAKSYVYLLVSKKAIPHQKLGKKIVFEVSELLEWIKAGRYDYSKTLREQKATEYIQKKPLKNGKSKQ
jgi:hypothetical protein